MIWIELPSDHFSKYVLPRTYVKIIGYGLEKVSEEELKKLNFFSEIPECDKEIQEKFVLHFRLQFLRNLVKFQKRSWAWWSK